VAKDLQSVIDTLLKNAARGIIPVETLARSVAQQLDGASLDAIEAAVRALVAAYPTGSDERYLLVILAGSYKGPLRDIFVRALQ